MKNEIPYMKGMNFGFAASRGWYGSEKGLAQIEKMKALNIDWVAIHVTFVQETYASTRVYMDFQWTPSDEEVITWVKAAHAAGLKVILKPILEPLDGVWRGVVDPPKDGASTYARLNQSFDNQSRWVESFKAALAYFVNLATRAEVECLCLGAEYYKLEIYNYMWDEIVADARARYKGLLTYEFTPHGLKDRVVNPQIGKWWHQLDFLGFSAYGSNDKEDATVADFIEGLKPQKEMGERMAREFDKPLALLETGRRSSRGLQGSGSDFSSPGVYDEKLQSRYMEAVYETFKTCDWYRGFFWWKWEEHQGEFRPQYHTDPAGDQGFIIEGKAAAETMKKIYER